MAFARMTLTNAQTVLWLKWSRRKVCRLSGSQLVRVFCQICDFIFLANEISIHLFFVRREVSNLQLWFRFILDFFLSALHPLVVQSQQCLHFCFWSVFCIEFFFRGDLQFCSTAITCVPSHRPCPNKNVRPCKLNKRRKTGSDVCVVTGPFLCRVCDGQHNVGDIILAALYDKQFLRSRALNAPEQLHSGTYIKYGYMFAVYVSYIICVACRSFGSGMVHKHVITEIN